MNSAEANLQMYVKCFHLVQVLLRYKLNYTVESGLPMSGIGVMLTPHTPHLYTYVAKGILRFFDIQAISHQEALEILPFLKPDFSLVFVLSSVLFLLFPL